MQSTKRRTLTVIAMSLLGAAAFGCTEGKWAVELEDKSLQLLAGDSASIPVSAHAVCEEDEVCPSLEGFVFDYRVTNLPPGVSYSVDTSLQSLSTPAEARIEFAAHAAAAAGDYDVVVHATIAGQPLGSNVLALRIVSLEGLTPAPRLVDIAVGRFHSAAVDENGTVWTWGRNASGELGDGTFSDRTIPRPVEIPEAVEKVVLNSLGLPHAGRGFALSEAGRIWAWGDNEDGTLGIGDQIIRLRPTRIEGIDDVVEIAARGVTLALRSDGSVWSWGRDDLLARPPGSSGVPGRIPGLSDVIDIAVAGDAAFALRADGSVWSWGYDLSGILGYDPGLPSDVLQLVRDPAPIPGLPGAVAIAAGSSTAYALTAGGAVWCWGAADKGECGFESGQDAQPPTLVPGIPPIAQISGSRSGALARALDGSVWYWERGFANQLAPGAKEVVHIAGGSTHLFVLEACGGVWGVGNNLFGEMGIRKASFGFVTPFRIIGLGDDSACDEVGLGLEKLGTGDGAVVADGLGSCPSEACQSLGLQIARGSTVSLSATPDPGSVFEGWALDCVGSAPDTMVTLDRSRVCGARFRAIVPERNLLLVVGENGRVTSSGGGVLGPDAIDCGEVCGAIFPGGTEVTLHAAPDPGFGFEAWTNDCAGSDPTTTVAISARTTCVASFVPYTLSVATVGMGRVVSVPAGIDCGAACSFEPRTASVELTALPELGWSFQGFADDCTGQGPSVNVTMDADRSCTASFERDAATFLLSISVQGDGSVASMPGGIDCAPTCVAAFPADTVVTLSAVPGVDTSLLGWFADCIGSGVETQIVMDADKSCTAAFVGVDHPAFPLAEFSILEAPQVGRLVHFDAAASTVYDPDTGTSDVSAITHMAWDFGDDGTIDVEGSRDEMVFVQHAFQSAGEQRVRLIVHGGASGPDGTAGQTSVVYPFLVSAADPASPLHSLQVGRQGTGSGFVVSDPPGLVHCGHGCGTLPAVVLQQGSSVLLRAEPLPGSNSTFVSWQGCPSANGNQCDVDMAADVVVRAEFDGLRVVARATPDRIAAGESSQLGLSITGGSVPYTFYWRPAASLDDGSRANPIASPTSTTLYEVTVTDALGNFASAAIQLDVDLLVTPSATPSAVGFGGVSQLDVSLVGGIGPYTYGWTPAITLDDATRRDPQAHPLGTTLYTVVVTDALGAQGVGSVQVAVDAQNLGACLGLVPLGANAVQIDATCSLGSIVEYRYWDDFQSPLDPPREISASPLSGVFVYELSGNKVLRVEVVDAEGNTDGAQAFFLVP